MNNDKKPQNDAAAEAELKGVPEEFHGKLLKALEGLGQPNDFFLRGRPLRKK